MSTPTIEVNRFEPLGAAIIGADVETLLDDDRIPALVLDALEENGVVVFPELGLDDEQQVAFARRLGEIHLMRPAPGREGRNPEAPEIYHVGFSDELRNELYVKGAFLWHIDGTTDTIPSKASVLSGRSLPSDGIGGDTLFVSTYDAYDRLSDEDKERCSGLRVEHSAESAYLAFDPEAGPETIERLRLVPTQTHPLVWTHRSGRKSLVLGTTAGRIVGMPEDEGKALLADLLARATEPEFQFRHRWTVGDLVIWDNRGTLHRADPYAEDSGRMMHRVTLAGDEPIV